jgi:glutathione S-transferase
MIPALRTTPDPRRGDGDERSWSLWSSTLSPFALKVDAMCDYAGLPHRWMPTEGTRQEGFREMNRVRAISAGRLPLTYPQMSELDELPVVPFLLGPCGENLYDSSAIGEWLDSTDRITREGASPLIPRRDDALRFAIRMVDEYFDEFGLYMVHHNRWKIAARDNGAGGRLAADMRVMLGPMARVLAGQFPARQVRRLPYLFSVGAVDDREFDDLPRRLRPPARPGFPATHSLLEDAYARILSVLETLLEDRPYLFGAEFTLADASAYGQLAMNTSDQSADDLIRKNAPGVHGWLQRIGKADFSTSRLDGRLVLDAKTAPLFEELQRVFIPLMQQNASAYQRLHASGERLFNEAGFDAGRALFDGELDGRPFRAVAKTFQVRVWRSLLENWHALSKPDRDRLNVLGLDPTTRLRS